MVRVILFRLDFIICLDPSVVLYNYIWNAWNPSRYWADRLDTCVQFLKRMYYESYMNFETKPPPYSSTYSEDIIS